VSCKQDYIQDGYLIGLLNTFLLLADCNSFHLYCLVFESSGLRIFILPKKIIRLIEQKFNRFLWNGKDEKAKAKVAWETICMPKKEGGLGIKRLATWNQVSVLNHIWNFFSRSGSLWVTWCKENWLKGRSFW
jgi:hypothetical protein